MKRVIFMLGISVLLQACIVSRVSRPKLTGYVVNIESKNPIFGCNVGESITDSMGYYELKEKRYLDITWIGMEAPPLLVQELVEKEEYIIDTIQGFNRYGGGMRKGAHWEMDTIFLKKKTMNFKSH
ncbi:hypothetical protein ACFLQ3_01570 [Bacteroidota bacterium]